LRLLARRGENVLVALVLPVAVLVFFGVTRRHDLGSLLPATVALAIVAAGFVSLGIATAYERSYGVLKRLSGAPVSTLSLVAAKLGSVLVVAASSTIVLVVAAVVLGWAPREPSSPLVLVIAVVLGVVAFGGLGLALASLVRAEAALAIANGVFLVFVLLGGIVVPIEDLPAPIRDFASVLPSMALADAVGAGLAIEGADAASFGPLLAWAVGGMILAVLAFRAE
jgi:ABC-2 type transport system permease protein